MTEISVGFTIVIPGSWYALWPGSEEVNSAGRALSSKITKSLKLTCCVKNKDIAQSVAQR